MCTNDRQLWEFSLQLWCVCINWKEYFVILATLPYTVCARVNVKHNFTDKNKKVLITIGIECNHSFYHTYSYTHVSYLYALFSQDSRVFMLFFWLSCVGQCGFLYSVISVIMAKLVIHSKLNIVGFDIVSYKSDDSTIKILFP